jgi:ketol-acid reductoisomerase
MPAKIYYDNDADSRCSRARRSPSSATAQGHAQAQNLRDSGCNVIVGQRPGTAELRPGRQHGFKPMSGRRGRQAGDLINILLPDEVQGDVYRNDIRRT